jgi:hypothetical protein
MENEMGARERSEMDINFDWKTESKRQLARSGNRPQEYIIMHLKEIILESWEGIHVAPHKNWWWAVVNTIMSLHTHSKQGIRLAV